MHAIGFFDSGVGGLTVLKPARALLPHEDFIYFGDNANAPYGTRSQAEILDLTMLGVSRLMQLGIKALVLACNTATSAAAVTLRKQLDIPVIAMEPALKPAQAMRQEGQILVLATPATLALPRFQVSMELYGRHAVPVPLPGLVELVEGGQVSGPAVEALLTDALAPLLDTPTDAIVLGCTHYPFVAGTIRQIAGDRVPILDGAAGTAAQLRRVLDGRGLLKARGEGTMDLRSTGGEETIRLMERLYYGL